MKDIKIAGIEIINFKGIKRLSVQLDGRDAVISGRNASGKTTVEDAFLWTLFGRDSRGAATFDVFKPLDDTGAPVLGNETTVEVKLDVDGMTHTLKRGIMEKWEATKQRAEKVYKGDTGAYWVDEIPKSKGEYDAFVSQLLPEAQFKLLTNYEEFMRKNTAERRLVLLSLAPADIDAILAERIPDCAKALEGASAEDQRKRLKDRKSAAQKELDGIPDRLDELRKQLVGADASDRERLEADVKYNTTEIQRVNEQLAVDPKAAIRVQLSTIESKIEDIERTANRKRNDDITDARRAMTKAQEDLDRENDQIRRTNSQIKRLEDSIGSNKDERDRLRRVYKTAYEATFVAPEIANTCPTCGQSIPDEQIEDALAKAEEKFAADKAATLAKISSEGKSANGIVEQQEKLLAEHREDLEKSKNKVADLEIALETASSEYERASDVKPEMPEDYKTYIIQRDELRNTVNSPESAAVTDLKARRNRLEQDLAGVNAEIAKIDILTQNKARIEQLEQRQRDLGDQVVALKQQEFLVERYVRERCKLLEDSINESFPSVRWRLFVDNKGEGFKDACDCMVPGPGGVMVPYEQANTGARINAGMEIVNVLAQVYGVVAPVFVDNAESVNKITQTIGQQIMLEVSPAGLAIQTKSREV